MRWLVVVVVMWLMPATAMAQGSVNLVADTVTVEGTTLSARGNVQVFYDGTTLSAAAITYSQDGDRLHITGPLFIRTSDGTVVTAQAADLDPRLENGVLRSARLVLNQQLQLAANQIDRVDGRFSQLTRTAATSCHVCNGRAPLWEIRADRVIHDDVERQIYFDNARFLVRGVPIFWVPSMRLPDPTLDRATGLLIPRIRSSNLLSTGIKLPYFFRIGDSRDLTLTPFVSSRTRTLEARYRQAFLRGEIEFNGAITRDEIIPGATRSYLFGEGAFDLGDDYQLAFDIETTSDEAYLLDYGFSDKDRLDSAISILRVGATDLFQANITYYDSLRDDEIDATLPPIVANLSYERRLAVPQVGGHLTFGATADGFERTSNQLGDQGRDVARAGLFAQWDGQHILPIGVVIEGQTRITADYYGISQDLVFGSGARQTAAARATLRWPLIRRLPSGTTHILEPVVNLGWSGTSGIEVPNEDGTMAEFDEGNLFALSRFPGQDARESGSQTAIGVTWTRSGASGTQSRLTFGRLFQGQPQTGFSPATGLSQQTSDWLLSAHLGMPGGLTVDARALFDDTFDFENTEARVSWTTDRFDMIAAYHWLPSDPTRDRPEPAAEWSIDATYRIDDQWRISVDGRYDVAADEPRRAGLGVEWRNECVTVDLSVSRRYTTSDTVEPSTDYGFSVGLSGFSLGRSAPARSRSCHNN